MDEQPGKTYPHKTIEASWQKRWLEADAFKAVPRADRPKFYLFEYPPYPNGKLHIGHVRNYSIGDATARFRRMRGYSVLYTQGFDAFGLPTDLAAREQGCHPADLTDRCIERIRGQFDRFGLSYDRDRLVAYHKEDYYRWTQWIFLKLLEAGLAYRGEALVNWCDHCLTTLADDQVERGTCWRCHNPTRSQRMIQWFVRTTAFSDSLLNRLETMPLWPEKIKKIQSHWIGKSAGLDIRFELAGAPGIGITGFTSFPELVFGMRFVVLSLEHPALEMFERFGLLSAEEAEALEKLRRRSQEARGNIRQGKKGRDPIEGFVLRQKAVHPLTREEVPIAVANYVEPGFATGALGGVPAHDLRDHQLAARLGLPSRRVLVPPEEPHTAEGTAFGWDESWIMVSSGPFDGLTVGEARGRIAEALAAAGAGGATVHYRLRDWLISRQRYWGPPIPVVHCPICGAVPVPEADLPVRLPYDIDLSVNGNPLEHHREFVMASCPRCGRVARRETDTMDTFMNCLWFFYRYAAGSPEKHPFRDPEASYWMPADVAIGGIEHATTTYFQDRFLTRALQTMGMADYDEPFERLVAHEMVIRDGRKMSKSFGNTVDPDDLIERYGADSLRLAILFVTSPDKRLEWSDSAIRTCHTFLAELWDLGRTIAAQAPTSNGRPSLLATELPGELPADCRDFLVDVHRIVEQVTQEYERYQLNVVIHRLMKLKRRIESFALEGLDLLRAAFAYAATSYLVRMLAPISPHLCEELWMEMGESGFIMAAPWPEVDRTLLARSARTLVIQMDGALQGEIKVEALSSADEVKVLGLGFLKDQGASEGEISKIQDWLYVRGKRFDILNFVTEGRRKRDSPEETL